MNALGKKLRIISLIMLREAQGAPQGPPFAGDLS